MPPPPDTCFLCGDASAGVAPCRECDGVVSVCADESHLAAHRPRGLGRCLPFAVVESADAGRFFIAANDIARGEIVVVDEAALVAPSMIPGLYPANLLL